MHHSGQDAGPRRLEFLGCRVDACTLDDAVNIAQDSMARRTRLQHADVNVAKLISLRRDPQFHRSINESDLICIDGMGIVWGARLSGLPIPERVTGIDLMLRLLELCERKGFRPYFLGSRDDVLRDAVAAVKRRHPRIEFAGARHGYFEPAEEAAIVADIRASGADCLFVGMTSPFKENFLSRYRDELGVPVQIGVGGAFDVVAGRVRRAPSWMQNMGLEWLFRLLQEPRRLWRRYLVSNVMYAALLSHHLLSAGWSRLATRVSAARVGK